MLKIREAAMLGCLVLPLAAGLPTGTAAQTVVDMDPRGGELDRAELVELLQRLEEAASSTGYSRQLREQAVREVRFVRERLEEGDFRVGDRVVLQVQAEPQLTDTFTVTARQAIDLPQIGEISLRGVLRSELEQHLRSELANFIREPVVSAQALIRVAVLGAVGRPGFYTLPASVLLENALMEAGGPAGGADIGGITVQRGEETLWEGDLLQRAMVEGRTLDQLSLQAGDRIVVPVRREGFFERGFLRTMLVVLPPLVYLVAQLTR